MNADWKQHPDAHPDPDGAPPRAPCADCLRRSLATARAALVSALGYARILDRSELAARIETILSQIPAETPTQPPTDKQQEA